ncbi:U6 small nuclear RNA (adenine-(43)-N(6))-methyltransferase [Cladobotryum mycophilum]|uniref:U6 small nuclear RNA (Adenine-(43)-N(6))-methyltransferase n=1 Tax=Cladobotryum mycophilum TaxID=491253 RepID=A0ABR0SXS8_9HYPO
MEPPRERDSHAGHDSRSSNKQLRPWERHDSITPTQSARESKDYYFRQLYKRSPDFKELARLDPDFSSVIKGRDLDFNDPKAVVQLTKTLLKLDFGLAINLPDDRLCPPVANRHNYILWLKDLLDATSYDSPDRKVLGLDIGTGASCIYPLLGSTERPWSFIATDIDEKSLACARANVQLNNLEAHISVVGRRPQDKLIPIDDLNIESIDFTMTNPPFYESEAAMVEMVTQGGEVGFVGRILGESLVLRERVQWYTAMVGFLSSLTHIIDKLRENGVDNYAVTEFVQGNKTRRWAIAWSFRPMRPTQEVARGTRASLSRNILPPITEYVVVKTPLPKSIGNFADSLSADLAALELISWQWDRERLEGVGRAADKVWARAWRRKKKRDVEMDTSALASDEKKCVFGFKVAVRVRVDHLSVECRWMEGHDESAPESFRGFLKAAAEKAIQGSEAK